MTLRETDLAINMVKEKRKDENQSRETFATRSVALPYMSRGLQTQEQNHSNQTFQTPTPSSQAGVSTYRLLPVCDSVLKPDTTVVNNIPSTVSSYSHDLRMVHRVKEGEEFQEYSNSNYSPNDEIDEGYRTNSSLASGSPSSCSVASFECLSPREDNTTQPLKNDEKYVTGQIGERIEDEKGNMMWLVDFKLDFLNDIEKDGGKEKRRASNDVDSCKKRIKLSEDEGFPAREECSPINLSYSPYPAEPSVRVVSSAKPNYTYTDLITLALKDKTSLTVSGIYQWITENYPYFKAEDDRWKNSVRHNLSMNPNFRKGGRAKQGSGHVWVLADLGDNTAMVRY